MLEGCSGTTSTVGDLVMSLGLSRQKYSRGQEGARAADVMRDGSSRIVAVVLVAVVTFLFPTGT